MNKINDLSVKWSAGFIFQLCSRLQKERLFILTFFSRMRSTTLSKIYVAHARSIFYTRHGKNILDFSIIPSSIRHVQIPHTTSFASPLISPFTCACPLTPLLREHAHSPPLLRAHAQPLPFCASMRTHLLFYSCMRTSG